MHRLKRGLTAVELRKEWENIVGKPIANHTSSIELRNRVLHVHLDSSVARQELHFNQQMLLARLNEHVGDGSVTSVRLY